jgi:hypothetical protein
MDERKPKNNQVFKNKTCEMAEEKERHQKPNISGKLILLPVPPGLREGGKKDSNILTTLALSFPAHLKRLSFSFNVEILPYHSYVNWILLLIIINIG